MQRIFDRHFGEPGAAPVPARNVAIVTLKRLMLIQRYSEAAGRDSAALPARSTSGSRGRT
jgi:hypothetical protein